MFPDIHDYDRTAPQISVSCKDPMPVSWAMPAPYEGVPEMVRPALGFRTPFLLIWCRSPGGSPAPHGRIPVKTIYLLRIIRSGHASRAMATPWPPSAYGPSGPRPATPSPNPCVRLSTPTSGFTPRPRASTVAAHNPGDNGVGATQVRFGSAFAHPLRRRVPANFRDRCAGTSDTQASPPPPVRIPAPSQGPRRARRDQPRHQAPALARSLCRGRGRVPASFTDRPLLHKIDRRPMRSTRTRSSVRGVMAVRRDEHAPEGGSWITEGLRHTDPPKGGYGS